MVKIIECDLFDAPASVIAHQVNCLGVMGAGVARQIALRFPDVYMEYVHLCHQHRHDRKSLLGSNLSVCVTPDLMVANMFAQEGVGTSAVQTDYGALRACMESLHDQTNAYDTIAMPYLIGCGLGGGDWNVVCQIIWEELSDRNGLICKLPKTKGEKSHG